MKLSLAPLAALLLASLNSCSPSPGTPTEEAGDSGAPCPSSDAAVPSSDAQTCSIRSVVCDCVPDGRLAVTSFGAECDSFVAGTVCAFLEAHHDILCPQPADGGAE